MQRIRLISIGIEKLRLSLVNEMYPDCFTQHYSVDVYAECFIQLFVLNSTEPCLLGRVKLALSVS